LITPLPLSNTTACARDILRWVREWSKEEGG
jgi:hypothetical protein